MLDDSASTHLQHLPLEVLPCANIDVDTHAVCENPGKQACSACKLVSYCSKECQSAHWTTHKRDCRNAIRSSKWKPSWIVEGREPRFLVEYKIPAAEEVQSLPHDSISFGVSLWGKIPAIDVVNLQNNEQDLKKDLTLAFPASCDIRHIITTVNALGPDYSGKLKIVLSDWNPCIVSRNIALLLILGTISDEVVAADMALHFWYSVLMPLEYHSRILSMVSTLVEESNFVASLGPHSTLNCQVSSEVQRHLVLNAESAKTPDGALFEYQRVRTEPSRVDFRDRMYFGLRPSHRLAFLKYRQSGVILPFGALQAHCNVANSSLFADLWLQSEYADPLESWDLDHVIHAGKAHGAQPEDIYGCLYFFLTDQLRAFSRHIRQHNISFHVFDLDAYMLARDIAQGKFEENGVPATTRFDRIHVSTAMDPRENGIPNVINAWKPLLAKTDHATLLGHFVNWVGYVKNGRVQDSGMSAIKSTLNLMERSNRLRTNVDPMVAVHLAMKDINAFYENSKEFTKYWNDLGGAKVKLQLRASHKIVPHRIKTDLDAKLDALPDLVDDEAWYRHTALVHRKWVERFVELCHGA